MRPPRVRHLVIELAGALLTLALIAFLLEKVYGNFKTPLDYTLGPLKTATDTTFLILGNSHAGALGLQPLRSDDRVYSAAVGGQDLYRSYLLLRNFLPGLPRIREVLVGVDYDAIGYNLSVFNQNWQDRQYFPYTGQLYRDGAMQRLLARSAFFRSNRDLSLLFAGSAGPAAANTNSMLPVGNGEPSTPEACRKRAKEHSEVKFREGLIEQNSLYLQEMAQLGQRHRIVIHFVSTPKRSCYSQAYSPATRARGRGAILRALGPYAGQFHDYFGDSRFSDGDFLDDDHLNSLGARKLLEDLARRASNANAIVTSAPRTKAL